jgi:hypothetical protein
MHLTTIGVIACFSPTQFHVIALYITGLILLDRRQNACRISRWLPARSHDAINRLLRVKGVSTSLKLLFHDGASGFAAPPTIPRYVIGLI